MAVCDTDSHSASLAITVTGIKVPQITGATTKTAGDTPKSMRARGAVELLRWLVYRRLFARAGGQH